MRASARTDLTSEVSTFEREPVSNDVAQLPEALVPALASHNLREETAGLLIEFGQTSAQKLS